RQEPSEPKIGPTAAELGGSSIQLPFDQASPSSQVGDRIVSQLSAKPASWQSLIEPLGLTMPVNEPCLRHRLIQFLTEAIARLDGLLSRQVNAILHHPSFQKLEASWRGLRYLVEQVEEVDAIRVRVLNVTWKELVRDLERAIEFDQSQLFRKVYGEEF